MYGVKSFGNIAGVDSMVNEIYSNGRYMVI